MNFEISGRRLKILLKCVITMHDKHAGRNLCSNSAHKPCNSVAVFDGYELMNIKLSLLKGDNQMFL